MNLGPFEIKRKPNALDKRVQTHEQQAVRVTDLSTLAAQLTGQRGNTGAGDASFPFGPLNPLPPMGTPREQTAGPRRFQYSVGANVQFIPRTGEAVSFAALRNFARLYDIARICIQVRKEEMQGLEWKIVARERGKEDDFAEPIKMLTEFFAKPDRRNTFDDWMGMLLEDIFVIDAMTLHKQPTRGGDLYGLRVVDGATMHPVIDEVGEIYGYQQIIYGVPRTAYIDADYAYLMPDANKIDTVFPFGQLIYRPRVQIPDSVYGFPPLEWVIVTVNQAIRKQVSDLSHYTEGNIPEALAPMPDGTTIEQALQFNDDFNALLAGDPRMRARLHWMPGGIDPSKVHEFRPFTTDTAWDEMLVKKTCAAFGVSPQEIGFTYQVNRATGEMQENVQYRRSIEPITQFFESMLSEIIKDDFGYPELLFKFNFGEIEDSLKLAQVDDIYVKNGVRSVDEVRSERQLGDPFGINRPFVVTTNGPIYLDDALERPIGLQTGNITPSSAVPGATDQSGAGTAISTDVRPAADVDDSTQKVLAQWKENSLKRLKAGKRPKLDFESDTLSADIHTTIAERLGKASTAEEVRAAFDRPFFRESRWARYP